tara:strand:- start:284 stop:481 length:198 start_codon:yes stop_codon:yes gene_type:complete
MDIRKIDKQLQPVPSVGLSKEYGVLGVCLGKDLYARLKGYSTITKIPMSRIIKILVKNYLDEKGT